MSQSLQEQLGEGRVASVAEACATGLELLRLLEQRPELRDPVEIALDDGATLRFTDLPPSPGLNIYACPMFEQAPGSPPSQVYFVAAVVYHRLTGRPPFPDIGPDALAVRKLLEPVAALGPEVPEALAGTLLACLSADIASRPSVPALRAALEAGARKIAAPQAARAMPAPMAPRPVAAPGGSAPTAPPARPSRWPLIVGAGLLGMILLGTAGLAAIFTFSRGEQAAPASVASAPMEEAAPPAPVSVPQPQSAPAPAEDKRAIDEEAPGSGAPLGSSGAPSKTSSSRPRNESPRGAPSRAEPVVKKEKEQAMAPDGGGAPATPALTPEPVPVSRAETPSWMMWALVLVPLGLGLLLVGAGTTGAIVYYTTRTMRKPKLTTGGSLQPVTPRAGASDTFNDLAEPIQTAHPTDDPIETGFQPFHMGPFWCFGRLGEGGMGVVYKARHQALGRLSAVKALPPRLARDARSLSWFRREAQLAARIQHPNVVAIFDYGELPGGLLYLAMEYVDGEPLSRRVRPGGLPASEVRALVTQIAAGLDAAHAAGIVHRDLKPDNVVVQSTPNAKFNAKILDFGIARPADGANETSAHLIVGTAAYMSPEQARGEPDLDARSDLFSLGVMSYELLSGRVPFVEPNLRTIQIVTQRAALDGPPPPLRTWRHDLSPAVDRALASAMAPRREDRPASASQFAEALGKALGGWSPPTS